MRKILRPAFAVPAAMICLAFGFSLQTGTASALAPVTSNSNGVGATTGPAGGSAAVGSGEKNLYSSPGGVPDVNDPGQYLYVQGCSTCHGVNGGGSQISDKIQAPSLIGVGAADVDFWVSTGRMPLNQPVVQAGRKKPAYSREQIDQLIKYVTSLTPANATTGPAIPAVDTSNANIVDGNQLFANNCAACHNSQGSGGAVGKDYYAPNLYQATDTQIAEAIRVGPGTMPVFGSKTLSDTQVNSLVKYVSGLKDENNRGGLGFGAIGPVSEGFIGWIVGLVLLLALTRWIGTRV